MGYCCPWTSIWTTLGWAIAAKGSEVQAVELLEQVGHAALDQVALLAQACQFDARRLGAVDARLQAFDFAFELAVFLCYSRLLALDADDGVHEQLDLFLESIDRFDTGGGRLCRDGHLLTTSALPEDRASARR